MTNEAVITTLGENLLIMNQSPPHFLTMIKMQSHLYIFCFETETLEHFVRK